MREYTVLHGGKYRALSEMQVETWLQREAGLDTLDEGDACSSDFTYNLFAFPAEDNFAGVKYPLEWIPRVQAKSTPSSRWMVSITILTKGSLSWDQQHSLECCCEKSLSVCAQFVSS